MSEPTFQQCVHAWALKCLGEIDALDKTERNHRFLEEALETVQANGCTREEAHRLADYVFDRPKGELSQEIGGAMVTLAALCNEAKIDLNTCADIELRRIWTNIEKVKAKRAAKREREQGLKQPSVIP